MLRRHTLHLQEAYNSFRLMIPTSTKAYASRPF
ncbi:hypothetical protein [Pseudomonas phage vB_Pa-PAC2]|nr:hypothetical protein Deiofobo_0344 [Pseudomonas phage Deifobo]WPK40058.1 hypothetical protein ETTORE_0349 [Pseudomonas phage Ettore]WPK40576.1 hypothetical protein Paride_0346 [Pseudomonas phage Paride]